MAIISCQVSKLVFVNKVLKDEQRIILQKRAVSAIYNRGPRGSLKDSFKEINILTKKPSFNFHFSVLLDVRQEPFRSDDVLFGFLVILVHPGRKVVAEWQILSP